jgi:myosin-1
LFHLEELVERKDYDCARKIQLAWKKWQLAKHALEQRARVADVLRGNKERQRMSINRQFVGDYSNYDLNYSLQQLIQQHSSMLSYSSHFD